MRLIHPQSQINLRHLGATQPSVRLFAVSTRYAPLLHRFPLIIPISKLLN